MSLFSELKRRNVFRVGAAYAVVGWLIIQLIDTLVPLLGVPDWVGKAILLVVIAGFPLALLFAWAFELTPEGLKKTGDVDVADSTTSQTGQKLNYAIVGALVLALGFIAWDKLGSGPTQTAEIEKSIAVLPFVAISSGEDDGYFADGLTEELLNSLAKLSDLKVAGRTSSFYYKGKTPSFQEVGAALGVAHILEGSVRRSGNRLRITAQLIQASDGFHLWTETYDRTLDDIFAIQEDIANEVTAALRVTLLGEEAVALTAHGTANAEAQSLYLIAKARLRQGRTFGSDQNLNTEHLRSARRLLEEVVRLDPDYAEAWAALSRAYLMVITGNLDASGEGLLGPDGVRLAGEALGRVLLLAPGLPEAHLAKAEHHWRNSSNVDGWKAVLAEKDAAISAFETALKLAPSNAEILEAYAQARIERGDYDAAIALYDRALAIDPFSQARLRRAQALFWSGRSAEATSEYRRIGARDPDAPWKVGIAEIEFDRGHLHHGVLWAENAPDMFPLPFALMALGDQEKVGEVYENLRRIGGAFADLLTVEELLVSRDYEGAERWFAEANDLTGYTPYFRKYQPWVASIFMRDWQTAANRFDALLNEFPMIREQTWGSLGMRKIAVERPVQINFFNATVTIYVAYSLVQLGRAEEADAAWRWAAELIASRKPLTANQKFAVIHFRALQAAGRGETEEALAALEELVDAGWRATMADVMVGLNAPYYEGDLGWFEDSPLLDSIRERPRFIAVVEKVTAANAAMLAELNAGLTLADIMDEK